ncbi:unnamed protein product [Brassica oleracea var. botrytis]
MSFFDSESASYARDWNANRLRMETPMVMAKRSAHVMNEIVSICNVETSFLVFSEAEKLYTFAHLSLEEAAGRLKSPLRHDPSMSTNIGPLMEAYKRQKIEDLRKKYIDLVEELQMENEKENI